MSTPQVVVTDLGIIRVHTVGSKDTVFLSHNNLRVFTVTCTAGKPSKFRVMKPFFTYDEAQWEEVFAAYSKWKRQNSKEFVLPNHVGRTKDGRKHPWRIIRKQPDKPS